MTQPHPYTFQFVATPYDADQSHLKTLAVCHYVWGGLSILISSIFIIYIVMGVLFLNGAIPTQPATASAPSPTPIRRITRPAHPPVRSPQPPPSPELIGWIFVGVGSVALLFGWSVGTLTIVSGRCLARQRNRTFSLVMAGVNCLSIPIGTTLGVFTFIVLFRPSVQAMYQSNRTFGETFPPAGR